MVRGRPRVVSTENLHKLFSENQNDIVKDNKVVVPSSAIWEQLSESMDSKMSSKAIYTAATRWWQSFFIDCQPQEHSVNNCSIETTFDLESSNTSDSSKENRLSTDIRFSITLAHDVWKTINPVAVEYNRKQSRKQNNKTRKYLVMKSGVWSNVILDRVATHRKNIVCSWQFKTCKIYVNGQNYARMVAKCTSCNATLIGVIKEIPKEPDPVKLTFVVQNFDEGIHKTVNKSVKNYGIRPREVAKSSETATTLSRARSHATGKMFEQPKGRQYAANSIRCRRYRDRLEKKLASSPIDALEYLQHSPGYTDTIQQIAKSPFYVMYRSPNQNLLWNEYKKQNRHTRVSCDGSGGFVHKLPRPGGRKSKQILLYNLVISDGFQVPINHLLGEPADANIILYWLAEWIRLGASIPDEFVSDMSLALIGGAVRVLTPHMTISSYVQYLFEMHDNAVQPKKPGCFIRVDFAHLMKAVAKNKYLKSVPKKVRDFYIRSVALLAKKTSLSEAKEHIYSVFVVALSDTEGKNEDDIDIPSEICKRKIIRKIMGIEPEVTTLIDEIDTEIEVEEVDVEEDEEPDQPDQPDADQPEHNKQKDDIENLDISDSNFSLWIQQLRKEAETTIRRFGPGDRDNLMFNRNFAKYFASLCSLLFLWSGVNCQFFNLPYETSSSANSESNFKNEKQAMKNLIPCSVDLFVKEHLKITAYAVTEASRTYITYIGKNGTNNSSTEDYSPFGKNNSTECFPASHKEFSSHIDDRSDNSTNEGSSIATNDVNDCIACSRNDYPTGAHLCYLCHKKVHILPGCSISLNEEEGYGERRICISCSRKPALQPMPSTTVHPSRSNNIEVKSKEKKTKQSCIDSYLNINKKVKLSKVVNNEGVAPKKTICIACKGNNIPTGDHHCYLCHKKVHILPGCSIPINDEEYGERRMCISCYKKPASKPMSSTAVEKPSESDKIAIEMNYKSIWKKRQTKKSIYTKPCINWDLTTNINKKAKIGLLQNGNLARTTYKVGNTKVALTNTCAFDSVAQLLAAAYSYYELYREVVEASDDGIFEIAILIAKNAHQSKVNNLRTKLLFNLFKKTSFSTVVSQILSEVLKRTPSFYEIRKCEACKYETEKIFPYVTVSGQIFENNMTNLDYAIAANLEIPMICHQCKLPSYIARTFGHHLFVEMPIPSLEPNINYNEVITTYKLSDIKLSIQIETKKYILLGLILFQPSMLENEIGHYVAAIRINEDYEVFDDYRDKTYNLKRNQEVVIHVLYYIDEELTKPPNSS